MRYLILIIALAGLIDASLALKVHYDTGTEPCSINAHWDCGIVNHSSFSMIHGVPVAAIGIAGYLLLAVLALARRPLLLLVASGAGLAYAIYLSGIEKNVLQTWCLYCVISQCIIALITLLSLVWLTVLQIGRRRTT
jgi:vitamin-K-epoxide reductase (warfarin-sensitive)